MGEVKQIEIKDRTYYFYNEIINLKNFESNLLKIDKKSYKSIDIYYIGYITIKLLNYLQCKPFILACSSCKWIYWRKNGNKYFVFDSKDENKELLMELKTK